jgi:hypothetical protein
LLHTLDNPDPDSFDYFGNSVSISDTYAIVGAINDDAVGSNGGSAYIFNPSTGALLHAIANPNAYDTGNSDSFGQSVSISDTYAIVGAHFEDDAGGSASGKAYIFNPSTGALLHTLDNPTAYGTSDNDRFGESVSISDTYAIVGARLEDDAGGDSSGKAYIFNPSTGALLYTIDNPNAFGTSATDYFGYSVSISDTYAVGGAWFEDDDYGVGGGKAYIFNPSTGALLHTLDNPNDYDAYSAGDNFGFSIDITDTYAIVGAYSEDDAGGTSSGKAYIYDTAIGSLLHTLDNPNAYDTSQNDNFGFSVGITDSYAIVGAYGEGDAGGASSGKAYIYDTLTGSLLHTLDNPNAYNTSAYDSFGYSVAISDTYAIVGAYIEDDAGGGGSGKAYIFNPSTGALLHTLDNPNAYNTSASDLFGRSVSISDSYAIVGAYGEDDAGGDSSGKAYIFNPSTGALLHTLDNPNAYNTSLNDIFGSSVSISDTYAIVGARLEDDAGGDSSGKAYIFNPSTGALLYTLENPNAYGTGSEDEFGGSVAITDNYAMVTALSEDDAGGSDGGKVYIIN